MMRDNVRKVLAPVTLLAFSVGAYFLVLLGVVPFGQEATVILTAIAGATTLYAAVLRATVPAVTAGIATIGFGLGTAAPLGELSLGGLAVTLGSALAIVGALGFLVSTLHLMGARLSEARPA